MTEMTPTRTEYAVEDRRWLRDVHGLTDTLGATLDPAAFTAAAFPDGRIPSGTVLGRITATDLWGPYDPAAADGRETNAGHLLDVTVVKAGRVSVAVLDHGAVLRDYLPTQATTAGRLDSAGEADLPRVRYTNGKGA